MNRNKLLLFAFILIVFVMVWMMLKVTGDDALENVKTANNQISDARQITEAERDTYVNTIATINERNRKLEERLNALETATKENKDQGMSDAMVEQLIDRRIDEGFLQKYQRKFDELMSTLPIPNGLDKNGGKRFTHKDGFNNEPDSLAQGLGFDSLLNNGTILGQTESADKPLTASELESYQTDKMVTVSPFTQIAYSTDSKNPVRVSITGEPIRKNENKIKLTDGKKSEKPRRIPFYTIPRNSTLFSNTTLTALLGIVPNIQGSVLDPIRFKLITGPVNLASNGHYIPGIRDIVWSGIAIGNREMSCVRGEVHSVTFTFEDGRVYTQSSVRDGNKNTSNVRKILGYISDTKGVPCLKGKLITNAQDYLTDRMIAAGIGSTADSFAETQKSTSNNAGVVTTEISGNRGDFIAAATLSGSLKELTEYMRERQRGAVDLVYLDGGQDVVLHIEDAITIDYLTNGRKLDYANKIPVDTPVNRSFD